MRAKLREMRMERKMTQQEVADYLNRSLVYYQKIEQGTRMGGFDIWDSLEDLFGVHQRILRQYDPKDNRLTRKKDQRV